LSSRYLTVKKLQKKAAFGFLVVDPHTAYECLVERGVIEAPSYSVLYGIRARFCDRLKFLLVIGIRTHRFKLL
jgi:hypothetical protein